jgi:hypothetical protein
MINQSILFKPGDVVSTVSPNKTILARAKIEYDIPREFAIYDLSKFIGAASIMQDCDLEFEENQLYMKSSASVIRYSYASPAMIVASPYKEIPIDDPLAKFELPYATLSNIIRAANVLELPDIIITTEKNDIYIQANNEKDSTSNNYRVKVGETTNTFKLIFKVETLKLINRDYVVIVPARGQLVQFKSSDIDYWVAASIS